MKKGGTENINICPFKASATKGSMSITIPVIDFEGFGFSVKGEVNEEKLKRIGSEMRKAFETAGFCYIRNHGFDEKLLNDYLNVCREFFEQPTEAKEPFSMGTDTDFGWVSVERERLNPKRPGDLKEVFNYQPNEDTGTWPSGIEHFQLLSQSVFQKCTDFTHRFLDVLSIGLELGDKNLMRDSHKFIGSKENRTALRSLYYPPIDPNSTFKPGQIRLGEHSDYGTITLLFQDDIGGLEVQVPGGDFIPATPIPGTLLVNIGDMMQRWTSDRLIATKHRVLIPDAELKKRKCRQSVAFFVNPDNDYIIRCLDGSNKYEPISSRDYLNYKLSVTY